MDDAGKQTFGNGQPKNQHSKPFFYVQPPSQPYYVPQQWQHNNPFSHYGLPAGFNFGRPCMLPYQYMQYPGFLFPQTPIYPMDYRRMFEPRFNAPHWNDFPRQHQPQHQQQQHQQRETACSEAQTDPSDAITKLIECLDKIRTNEQGNGRDRELDSGVASQSSGMFSPEEEKKNEEQRRVSPLTTHGSAVGETSSNRKTCWTGVDEDPPIDSSSFHEAQGTDEPFVPFENLETADVSAGKCAEDSTPSAVVLLQENKSSRKVSKAELLNEGRSDGSYQILKLPLENASTPPSAAASSPSTPYYYNYLPPQTTHERLSVLSPSLDELSSRDEMFSTDLDDVDFFPKRVYAGRRLPELCSGSSRRLGDEDETEEDEGWPPGPQRSTCACCGKRLARGASRSRAPPPRMYRDDGGDSPAEDRGLLRKHGVPRRLHATVRQTSKPWIQRAQYKEASDPELQDDGRDVCTTEGGDRQTAATDESELQCRTCQGESSPPVLSSGTNRERAANASTDRHRDEERPASDQGRWTEEDKTVARRSSAPSQRRETNAQWKVIYHRPGPRDDDEPPLIHWERGSTMRGEPR